VIGLFFAQTASVWLFKWQVHCPTISRLSAPSSTDCIGALLISIMSRSGSSKSVIFSIPQTDTAQSKESLAADAPVQPGSETALHIWLLNPHIKYTSSQRTDIKGAIKLLYKVIPRREAERLTESMTSDIQEVTTIHEALRQCIDSLELSNRILPLEQRLYKEWKVGLLDRYEA